MPPGQGGPNVPRYYLWRNPNPDVSVQVTDNRRVGTGERARKDPLHTPAGMSEPAARTGQSADGADIASTDMSQEPSSRVEDTQASPGDLPGGTLVEPQEEAVRRLQGQLDEARDQHLRLAAEFDNFRKRVTRERAELSDRAQAALVTRLLDVLDDMDRLNAGGGNASPQTLREGTTLVDRKLRKELEAAGLEQIDPVGQPFDPSVHEAVATIPAPTPDQDHVVSATFQTGYRYKGNLIRPARVQVYSGQGQA
jgi:molecular chaperone GrpE